MKKPVNEKQLKLVAEKIRNLDVQDLKDVVGGVSRGCKMSVPDK